MRRSIEKGRARRPARRSIPRLAVGIALLSAVGCSPAGGDSTGEASASSGETPPGVEQIIPRGRLAAIVDPEFVAAADAKLPDDQWVLGVVVDGDARAYDLNLLNSHEVVNDEIGGRPLAAVW